MGCAAVLFPGQGSQSVGMGRDVVQVSQQARAVFHQANEVLGFDLARLCFEGPANRLEQTDVQQPAIFVTSVALWEAFVEAGGSRDSFRWMAGLSLGEYTALHVAGAVGFEEALRLVHRRGQLMQEASSATPSNMVSLVGADEATAKALCERVRGNEVLTPANFNCPGQVVLSGSQGACERAVRLASDVGCRAVTLPVAGAFHSPLMESAAHRLWPILQETHFTAPAIQVMANVNAERHGDGEAIRNSLCQQVTQPVLWQRCVERIIDDGVDRMIEIGPGRILTGLMRKINRRVSVVNVSTASSITDMMTTAEIR